MSVPLSLDSTFPLYLDGLKLNVSMYALQGVQVVALTAVTVTISPFLLYQALADAAVNDTKNKTTNKIAITFLKLSPQYLYSGFKNRIFAYNLIVKKPAANADPTITV
jgi:hypothetical protein